jgi:hypothetical protein
MAPKRVPGLTTVPAGTVITTLPAESPSSAYIGPRLIGATVISAT